MSIISGKNTAPRKAPWFAVLSLVLPILGLPLAFGLSIYISNDFLLALLLLFYIGLGFAALGLVFAVVALLRSERLRVLSSLSCIVYASLLLWTLLSWVLAFPPQTAALRTTPASSKLTNSAADQSDACFDKGAYLFLIAKHNNEAITNFSKAIELNSNNANAYAFRGLVFAEANDVTAAMADVDKAIQLSITKSALSSNYIANVYLARGKLRVRTKDVEGALADCNTSLAGTQNPQAYAYRGMVQVLRGDLENAEADSTRALLLQTNCVEAYLLRGLVNEKREHFAEALLEYSKAIALEPNCEEAITARNGINNRVNVHAKPLMKEATRIVWNQLQSIEAQLETNYAGNRRTFFSQRGFLYAQINTDGADPLLTQYIAQVVDVSKDIKAILDALEEETQTTATVASGIESFYTALGTFLGATAQNGRSLAENAQDGETAGMIAGKITSGLIQSIPSSTFDDDIKRCESNLQLMSDKLSSLKTYLTHKYNTQFLSGF